MSSGLATARKANWTAGGSPDFRSFSATSSVWYVAVPGERPDRDGIGAQCVGTDSERRQPVATERRMLLASRGPGCRAMPRPTLGRYAWSATSNGPDQLP